MTSLNAHACPQICMYTDTYLPALAHTHTHAHTYISTWVALNLQPIGHIQPAEPCHSVCRSSPGSRNLLAREQHQHCHSPAVKFLDLWGARQMMWSSVLVCVGASQHEDSLHRQTGCTVPGCYMARYVYMGLGQHVTRSGHIGSGQSTDCTHRLALHADPALDLLCAHATHLTCWSGNVEHHGSRHEHAVCVHTCVHACKCTCARVCVCTYTHAHSANTCILML